MFAGSSRRVETPSQLYSRLAKRCGGEAAMDKESTCVLRIGDGESLNLEFYFEERDSAINARAQIEATFGTEVPKGWQATINDAKSVRAPLKAGDGGLPTLKSTERIGIAWADNGLERAFGIDSYPTNKRKPKKAATAELPNEDRPSPNKPKTNHSGDEGSLEALDFRREVIRSLTGYLSKSDFKRSVNAENPDVILFRPKDVQDDLRDVELRATPSAKHLLIIINSASENLGLIQHLTKLVERKKELSCIPVNIVKAPPDQRAFMIERRQSAPAPASEGAEL